MSPFLSDLHLKSVKGTKYFELEAPFRYKSNKFNMQFQIHAGYRTDFASIPRPFWTLIGHPAGKYREAAVVHDYLCDTKKVGRDVADAIFDEAMEELGVHWLKRKAMWAGVRTYWLAWGKWFS